MPAYEVIDPHGNIIILTMQRLRKLHRKITRKPWKGEIDAMNNLLKLGYAVRWSS